MTPAAPGSTLPGSTPTESTNGVVFWPIAAVVVLADVVTKLMATYTLHPVGLPHEVFGERVRLTLVYNPGAAFGLHLGPHSRWIFLVLTAVVLVALWRLYRDTRLLTIGEGTSEIQRMVIARHVLGSFAAQL